MKPPRLRMAIAAVLFIYVLVIRTYDITSTFLMLGDQIRDWTIALGGWRDLPLTGPPSVRVAARSSSSSSCWRAGAGICPCSRPPSVAWRRQSPCFQPGRARTTATGF